MDDSKRLLRKFFKPQQIGVEVVPLEECVGRVLAETIEANVDVPPFDRASMDGFGVQADNTYGADEANPISLKIIGKIGAGENPPITIKPGEAIEISTGAPIPKGVNAVVMVEYTGQSNSSLKIYRAVVPGENIMAAGSDIMAGELILRKGKVLTPRETGVLTAIGLIKVNVFKKPTIAIISTGDELVSPGNPLSYGKIYEINSRTLADSITDNGGMSNFLGIVGDNALEITNKIRSGIREADIVITSGSTSAGVGDLIYKIINDLGKPGIIVHGVSVKPGKPLIIAVVRDKPIFCLPGYPTSALMMFNIFVRPIIREMAGLNNLERRTVRASTAEKFFSSDGRRNYKPVNLIRNYDGSFIVYPIPGGSGSITTLTRADGFIMIPENKSFLEEGEEVEVELLCSNLKPTDLMIIGSHCIGIDIILDLMQKHNFSYKTINTGSSGGFTAIRRGEADIAGTHILDEKTGIYNIPFIERFEIANSVFLIRGYNREQGLIVAKGNPKNIHSIEDLIIKDISFVNRNPGSGTRILFETYINTLARKKRLSFTELVSKINGYKTETKSHTAVGVAVLQGKADTGFAISAVAKRYGLDFIPITEEKFDFLIHKEHLKKKFVKLFIETLRSNEFKAALIQRTTGLTTNNETGSIIYP